jgi:hypothetical protein
MSDDKINNDKPGMAHDLEKFKDLGIPAGQEPVTNDVRNAALILITRHLLTKQPESTTMAHDVTLNGVPYGDFEIIVRKKL